MSIARPAPATARGRHPSPRLSRRLWLLAVPLAGIAVWWGIAAFVETRSWLLPGPGEVTEALWADRGRLWFHARATIGKAAMGFGLAAAAGTALAAAIAASRATARAVYPWIVASQAVPILALAPIMAIWTDFGVAQILVAFLVTFFPVVVTGVDGLRGVDPHPAHAMRTLGATPGWIWRHITFPAALPSLFSGLRMAAAFSVTGAVVAEYVGADRGLGYLTELKTAQFETTLALAAIVLLAVIGVLFFLAVGAVERLVLPHRHRPTRPAWRLSW